MLCFISHKKTCRVVILCFNSFLMNILAYNKLKRHFPLSLKILKTFCDYTIYNMCWIYKYVSLILVFNTF